MTFTLTQNFFYIAVSLILLTLQVYQSVKTDKVKKDLQSLTNIVMMVMYFGQKQNEDGKKQSEDKQTV
jgi:hypothetical protein